MSFIWDKFDRPMCISP